MEKNPTLYRKAYRRGYLAAMERVARDVLELLERAKASSDEMTPRSVRAPRRATRKTVAQ